MSGRRTLWLAIGSLLVAGAVGPTCAGSEGERPPRVLDSGQLGPAVRIRFETAGFQLYAIASRIVWQGGAGGVETSCRGEVGINTLIGWDGLDAAGVPTDFTAVDVRLDRLLLGGGDGRGIVIDRTGQGGGDGRGIVLPHLIIDRVGSRQWRDVTVRFRLDRYQPPGSRNERLDLVWSLATAVEVWQSDEMVGRGNPAATFAANERWAVPSSGQTGCYGSNGPLPGCPGEAGSEECPATPWCGQDWHYSGYRDGERTYQYTIDWIDDPYTGLRWNAQPGSCDGGRRFECTHDEATAFCEGAGWRLPSLWEALTTVNFGRFNGATYEGFVNIPGGNVWTATEGAADGTVVHLDYNTGMAGPTGAGSDSLGRIVCIRDGFPGAAEDLAADMADAVAGRMWQAPGLLGDWQAALSFCEGSVHLGFTDWRVPDMTELGFWLLRERLPEGGDYWSGTSCAFDPSLAWALRPMGWDGRQKTGSHGIICVRTIP